MDHPMTEPIDVPAQPVPYGRHLANTEIRTSHRDDWMPMREVFSWFRPPKGRRRK